MSEQDLSGRWLFDPAHTRIGFSARHAMVARVRGAFTDVTGEVIVDAENPEASQATVVVQTASIDTRLADRDAHLRSADFFDVETYPEMTFRSERIEQVDDSGFLVVGQLTIRDVTRPLSIPLGLLGIDRDPAGLLRAGFEGTRRLDRREFGLTWNTPMDSGGILISDRIVLELEVGLIKQDEDAPAAEEAPAEEAPADDAPQGEEAPPAEAPAPWERPLP